MINYTLNLDNAVGYAQVGFLKKISLFTETYKFSLKIDQES